MHGLTVLWCTTKLLNSHICDMPSDTGKVRLRYGLVYPGLGWVIWRSKEYLPESIVFHVNYLGSDQASVTLNFSRGAGMIIAQYYQVRYAIPVSCIMLK